MCHSAFDVTEQNWNKFSLLGIFDDDDDDVQ